MKECVYDIEANGLKPTKIHCVGACIDDGKINSTVNYHHMRDLFTRDNIALIAHNGISYDKPALESLLGITINATLVDTLWLSWYLYPKRTKHGLADWGEEFGVPKPPVEDWEDQPVEVYINRVREDVKINNLLWQKMKKDLLDIYGTEQEVWRFIEYITFKAQCVADQEKLKWKLDVPRVNKVLSELLKEKDKRTKELESVMPKVPVYKLKKAPKNPYKMNGELSVTGQNWEDLLKKYKKPEWTTEIKDLVGYNEPNSGSHIQKKDWLFSLGWVPETFEFKRNKKTGEVKKIPQINIKDSGGELCPSIKKLFKVEPNLKVLEGLSIITHRITLFEGFLKAEENGYVKAGAGGLTNTLRLKHRELVNLPGVDKLYGEDIRGSLIADDGYILCGSDMEALEDRTKQHYMWDYDPEYVKDMMKEGYCPHVDIAVQAGFLNLQQEDRHRTKTFKDKKDKEVILAGRKKAKPVNYGGVYGQKPEGLSQSTGMPLAQAQKLYDVYWERNWSVEAIAKDCKVKNVKGQMWLKNPVSGFWYSLRKDKDRFSTLNQGTGAYLFDMWVKEVRSMGLMPIGQFHDEIILLVLKGKEQEVKAKIKKAIDIVNKTFKLNRDLGCDVQFGQNYGEIH